MNVRRVAEDDNTITLAWDYVAGSEGYIGTLDSGEILADGKRHFSLNPKLTQVKFAKVKDGKPHSYGIKILGALDSGAVTSPETHSSYGSKLPGRMPFSSGTGGIYYVDPLNGDDSRSNSNAQSKSGAWRTINKALGAVPLSGSIIKILPGSFTSSGFSYIPIHWTRKGDVDDPVTVQAESPGTVRIIGSVSAGQSISSWMHGWATGLRLKDLTFASILSPNSALHHSHVQLEEFNWFEVCDCVFYDVASMGLLAKGSSLSQAKYSTDVWVVNCTFKPSGTNPFAKCCGANFPPSDYFGCRGSHWLYIGQFGQDPPSGTSWNSINGVRRAVVANNVFVGSVPGSSVQPGPEDRDSFYVSNTFYGNHIIQMQPPPNESKWAGIGLGPFSNTVDQNYNTNNLMMANNLFCDLDGHAIYGSGPLQDSSHARYNAAYKTRNGVYGGANYQSRDIAFEPMYSPGQPLFIDDGNNVTLTLDPQFVNADGYDYHLRPSSPVLGMGDVDYMLPYNIEGIERTQPALGAY